MKTPDLRKLCQPAKVYLFIELLVLIVMIYQNFGSETVLCVGDYECEVESMTMVYIVKLMYIAFWTFILNLMCRGGYKTFAWFLVVFPIMLFFVLIGLLMMTNGTKKETVNNLLIL
jgi:hypothetical protein